MSNYTAPDGYRYGIRFADGSVSHRWNGATQRERATESLEKTRARQLAEVGRCDDLRLVRSLPGGAWELVP